MMKLRAFMKIPFSTLQTKNRAMRSNDICDDDDNLVTISDIDRDFYVFIKQMTSIAIIQTRSNDSSRSRNDSLEKLQISISK